MATSRRPVAVVEAEAIMMMMMMMMMEVKALRLHILGEIEYLHNNNNNNRCCFFFFIFSLFSFYFMHFSFIWDMGLDLRTSLDFSFKIEICTYLQQLNRDFLYDMCAYVYML